MIERVLGWIGIAGQRLGLDDVRFNRMDFWRLVVLAITCVVTSATVVDYARAPKDALVEGDPAPRTVRAPFTFHYADHVDHERVRREASDRVLPVFVYRTDLGHELQGRISTAFEGGRAALSARSAATPDAPPTELTPAEIEELAEQFREALGVHVPDASVEVLARLGFPAEGEHHAANLLSRAMDKLVLRDRDALPRDGRGVRLITLSDGGQAESTLTDLSRLVTPTEARQAVSLGVLEIGGESGGLDAAATIARALVRSNVSFAPLQTEEARREAEAAAPLELRTVKRGTILFRAGDTLTADHVQIYRELQSQRGETDIAMEIVAIALLLLLLLVSLYYFGATYLTEFSTDLRNVAAIGALLALTAVLGRVIVAMSEALTTAFGYDAEPRSVWFAVPVAGAAMVVRQLLGVGWTWMFAIAAATVCGLLMNLQVLPVVFFLISAVAGASAIEHARERVNVLRAGLVVGLVNVTCVLFIHFVQLVTEVEVGTPVGRSLLWSMGFAFLGGIASAFVVLALIPMFEAVGFVTDFRLMELANLNHPLLRELMLRAPGSYHHSVIVGTLAEAGCQRIGANGLRAKVASYFHDIGKSVKPPYFVENQRDGINRHDGLDPYTSARIIISHVTDGGRMAREHGLPKPIVDNIYMHHGTGILQYFYAQARAQADNPDDVDEMAFRYPGPRPNDREAGVIMLADKVEAATRTLKNPDESNIRAMISRIISSVIADGQFVECPLTLQEIHAIGETFVQVLLGIYHQRIEYPDTKDLSRAPASNPPAAVNGRSGRPASEPPREAFITLEILPSQPTDPGPSREAPAAAVAPEPQDAAAADEETSDIVDYESLEHLPRGEP